MIKLPKQLEKIKGQFDNTIKPFIEVKSKTVEKDIGILRSKFGGRPYISSIEDYPKDSNGKKMIPIAQINFDEVPNIEDFPKSGLLQFFISDNDYWGMNFSDLADQSDFRVLYTEKEKLDEKKAVKRDEFQIEVPSDFFVYKVHELFFDLKEAPITLTDFRCMIDQDYFYNELSKEMRDFYWNKVALTSVHKIGGYSHFGQDDPRFDKKYQRYTVQLLQILSDAGPNETEDEYKNSIHIGKTGRGTIHFLIQPEDLKNLKFDNVLYTWEHY